MIGTTIENPNFGPKTKVLLMMESPMLKVYKISKMEMIITIETIITETTTIQTMTIKIKTTIRETSNLRIKHNFFLTPTTLPTAITTMIMIEIGSSLTFVNLWMSSFKN